MREFDKNSEARQVTRMKWSRLRPEEKARPDGHVPKKGSVEFEREDMQHFLLEKDIVDLCLANNIAPLTNRHIDVVAQVGPVSVVFEMKACDQTDISTPLRRAVYQLLEYSYFYRDKLTPEIRLCIVIEHRPRGKSEWLMGYLEHLRIGLIWRDEGDEGFGCTELTKALVGEVLPQIREWKPSGLDGDLHTKAQFRRV